MPQKTPVFSGGNAPWQGQGAKHPEADESLTNTSVPVCPCFQNGGSSQKELVCDSIKPSGMDLYIYIYINTRLPAVHYA